MPSGYKPYTLHPSAAGTPAGFTMAVPPGWQVGQQTPQRIFFNAPDGVSNVEVDLTTHTTSDMVAEARSIKQQTQARASSRTTRRSSSAPRSPRDAGRTVALRLDDPKTGTTLRVDDMLFILQTANGPQSYAIYMTAPEGNATGSWNATILPIISQMLQSFTPTTS